MPGLPSSALSERFLDLTSDLAGAVSFDGRLVSANPALTEMLGGGGEHAGELVHPEDRGTVAATGTRSSRGTASRPTWRCGWAPSRTAAGSC
jgi:hypothetical protein